MAKCNWCGGEILEPVCVSMPENANEITYLIYDLMKEKRYCSEHCLRKHIKGVILDLMQQDRRAAARKGD